MRVKDQKVKGVVASKIMLVALWIQYLLEGISLNMTKMYSTQGQTDLLATGQRSWSWWSQNTKHDLGLVNPASPERFRQSHLVETFAWTLLAKVKGWKSTAWWHRKTLFLDITRTTPWLIFHTTAKKTDTDNPEVVILFFFHLVYLYIDAGTEAHNPPHHPPPALSLQRCDDTVNMDEFVAFSNSFWRFALSTEPLEHSGTQTFHESSVRCSIIQSGAKLETAATGRKGEETDATSLL